MILHNGYSRLRSILSEEKRLKLAAFALQDEAYDWYQWMHSNNMIVNWDHFENVLKQRFVPSQYKDLQGKLCKLTQIGSVEEYQHAFEQLSNKITGLSEGFLRSCFVSGLKPLIQQEVLAAQPTSLMHAISFARLHESKLAAF